jgi:alpha-L-fucosidase
MYGGNAAIMQWHTEHYGPPSKFGYKDFIPMFTAAKWDPAAWAELFRKSGAKYVCPSGEHHDGFSLWDSKLNKYNAKNMGPKRDLIGDLGQAVRHAGLKFGISNHSINHFNFIPALANSDQTDPAWAEFYSVADRSPAARARFNDLWVRKNYELIDQYQPDMLWFDGIGNAASAGMRLAVAAHYFNAAAAWHKAVTISGKYTDFPAGAVLDYERQGRILPRGLKDFAWQVDDPMGNKFAYVTEIQYKPAALLIRRLVDCVSMNGNYLMNISPMADGTIPQPQQDRLLPWARGWKSTARPSTRAGPGPATAKAPTTTRPNPCGTPRSG